MKQVVLWSLVMLVAVVPRGREALAETLPEKVPPEKVPEANVPAVDGSADRYALDPFPAGSPSAEDKARRRERVQDLLRETEEIHRRERKSPPGRDPAVDRSVDEARGLLDRVRDRLPGGGTRPSAPILRSGPDGERPAIAPPPPRPPLEHPDGFVTIREMRHKTADELIIFIREHFPEWIRRGHVAKIQGKGRSVMIFGDTPEESDPTVRRIADVIARFDALELKIATRILRPRFIDPGMAMEALSMRGLASVWHFSEEVHKEERKVGDTIERHSETLTGFRQGGLLLDAGKPSDPHREIPYVYEVPSTDPYEAPREGASATLNARSLVHFQGTASTEKRGGFVAVGTVEDIERIQAFVDSIDVPARRIMIEVQVISLEASKLSDLGIDSLQFGQNHTIGNLALPFPDEPFVQPGLGDAAREDPTDIVPQISQEGFQLIFDDTSVDLTGRFLTSIHALIRQGDARIKARPKILTLDDRISVLHIGREVPVFRSTGVSRDVTNGNLVNEVNEVGTQYVGFTLNLRPRVTGGAEDEVSLQIEMVVNELGERQRVFEADLLGIPDVIRRSFVGQTRVRNHRPIVLGGLIQEQETESINKIPVLGDIPYLGALFRRTLTSSTRTEVILVVTPHILSDQGVDRVATPKESSLFDTFDSVLFNDRHVIKGVDVLGIDPITSSPAELDGRVFEKEEIIDLTLLNIIKKRELVSKLRIFEDYLGETSSKQLNWIQRRWPERTVKGWSEGEQENYFRAAAVVLENIKELNPDLTYEEIVLPRREIVLPTTPYRISLTFDRVKALQETASPLLLRGQRVELGPATLELLRGLGRRPLSAFGEYLTRKNRTATEHGELVAELKRLYLTQYPESDDMEGLPYPSVYSVLGGVGMDFVTLATYFGENLGDRYRTIGAPDVGLFEEDLRAFDAASIGLAQRGRNLRDLQHKWDRMQSGAAEDGE